MKLTRYDATYKNDFGDIYQADISEIEDGDLVFYEDAAALEAENAALREKLAAAEARIELMEQEAIALGPEIVRQTLANVAAEARTVLTDEQIRTMARVYSYRAWGIEQVVEYTRAILAASAAPAAQEDARDAARYRWLRNQNEFQEIGSFSPYAVKGQTMEFIEGADLDKQVDAAIAANTPKGTLG